MKYQAEIHNGDDFLYVDLDFEVEYVDNSFSFAYGNISGVHDPGSGYEITGEVWDRSIYTPEENKLIEDWIQNNIHTIKIEP
jgi:hypothetical protein